LLGAFSDLTLGLILIVPNFDVYHTADVGLQPKILPSIDDFSEAYKPLAFVFREPNARWAPEYLNPILNRMSSRASSSFDNLRTRMTKITDTAGWREINAH